MEDRDLAETPAEFAVLQQLSQPAFEGRIDGGRFAAEFVFAFPMRKENGIRRLNRCHDNGKPGQNIRREGQSSLYNTACECSVEASGDLNSIVTSISSLLRCASHSHLATKAAGLVKNGMYGVAWYRSVI